jgi:hypothetical protein
VLVGWAFGLEVVEEAADVVAELGDVAECVVAVDRVFVATADAFALDVARFDEVGEDSLGASFGDPDGFSDVAHTDGRVVGEAEQDLRVVGDERP